MPGTKESLSKIYILPVIYIIQYVGHGYYKFTGLHILKTFLTFQAQKYRSTLPDIFIQRKMYQSNHKANLQKIPYCCGKELLQ